MKNKWWWVLVAGLLGLVSGMVACCTKRVQTNVWMETFNPLDSALAHTTCDMKGKPIIIINQIKFEEQTNLISWKYVIVHEQEHVRQMYAHKNGCSGALAQYRADNDYRLKVEMEATCAEFYVAYRDDVLSNPQDTFERLFEALEKRYATHLSHAVYQRRLTCNRP